MSNPDIYFTEAQSSQIRSRKWRPGDTINGSFTLRPNSLGVDGGYQHVKVKLWYRQQQITSTWNQTISSSTYLTPFGITSTSSVGASTSSKRHVEHEIHDYNSVLVSETVPYDWNRDGAKAEESTLAFALPIPFEAEGEEVLPSVRDWVTYNIQVVAQEYDVAEKYAEEVLWDLVMTSPSAASVDPNTVYPQFLMEDVLLPAVQPAKWVSNYDSISLPVPQRGLAGKLFGSSSSQASTGDAGDASLMIGIWAPEADFMLSTPIDIALHFVARVPMASISSPDKIDWEKLCVPLPLESGYNGFFLHHSQVDVKIQQPKDAEKPWRSKTICDLREEACITWSDGQLRNRDLVPGAGGGKKLFDLPGYGWSSVYQDKEYDCWARKAWIKGTLRLPWNTPESYTAKKGDVGIYNNIAYQQEIPKSLTRDKLVAHVRPSIWHTVLEPRPMPPPYQA